jgi:dTDP-6-deoxy-L-talose 4-dehydrogenase (NAD+)
MKILVTGATGYIGRYIVSELVKIPGHTIVASGRDTQKLKNIADNYNVQKVEFNLYEEQYNWFEMVGEPDMLIHLAWGGLDNYDSLCHIEQELCAHYSFLKNMIENGLPHLSVTGTCLEYGKQEGCMYEHTPTAPVTAYGVAKDTLHQFLRILQKNGGFSLKWLRLFYIYGEVSKPGSLLAKVDEAIRRGDTSFNMSGGEQLRDYSKLEDVARNIVDAALCKSNYRVFNICSEYPVSVRNMVEQQIKKRSANMALNLGFYPYPEYEPMAFWGQRSISW